MAKATKTRRRLLSRQWKLVPYPFPSFNHHSVKKELNDRKSPKPLERNDWEDATCSVCMEFPHNAVLLLCSSHDKGCRPYMCGTSYRYSNCLNEFKKAYTKVVSPSRDQDGLWNGSPENLGFNFNPDAVLSSEKHEVTELACPLCRGQVKGWTVVEAARKYLNAKKRTCMQDGCSFVGTYKELRKHVRAEHPFAQPREVDPILEQKWRRLEHERERDDVISTVMSSIPGAMVLGDYVIEGGRHGFHVNGVDENNLLNFVFLLQTSTGNTIIRSRLRRHERGFRALDDGLDRTDTPPNLVSGASVASTNEGENLVPVNQGRVVGMGRSERRRRHRSRHRSVVDLI